MGADKADVEMLNPVDGQHNQAVIVAANIAYDPVVGERVGSGEFAFDLIGRMPGGTGNDSQPGAK